MFYWNQRQYPHIPYPTNIMHGGLPPEKQTAAAAACGPCALCMTVDLLTDAEEAMTALGELTGRSVREDITSRIFSRFCVGK